MVDMYTCSDIFRLLANKTILFVGDSNIRNVYKDLVCLLCTNDLMDLGDVARNLEGSYMGDKLMHRSNMYKERSYMERRLFERGNVRLEFLFVTQCFSPGFVHYLNKVEQGYNKVPEVIFMNSFLWDITRWGPHSVRNYKNNLQKLIKTLDDYLPKSTMFIWGTTSPVLEGVQTIPLVSQLSKMHETLYADILEGNCYTAEQFRFHGYDVIDVHRHLFRHAHRRSINGINYDPNAIRYVTYLLLTHLALSWDITLPGRLECTILHEEITRSKECFFKEDPFQNCYKHANYKQELCNTSSTISNQHLEAKGNGKGTPLIRIKTTKEILQEFEQTAVNVTETVSPQTEDKNVDDQLNGEIDSTNFTELSELNKGNYEESEIKQNGEQFKKIFCEGKQDSARKIKDEDNELEDGEIREHEEPDITSLWSQWKEDQVTRDSRKDLLTLEISNYNGRILTLKPARSKWKRYHSKTFNHVSLNRINGFLHQLKRNLQEKRVKREPRVQSVSSLFGYEINERSELFHPQVSNIRDADQGSGSSTEWVAAQWKRIIQEEYKESIEVLGSRRRVYSQYDRNIDEASGRPSPSNYGKLNKRRNYSIAFL